MKCPKCNSPNWDYANVGVLNAILCTDCGHIYNGAYNGKGEQEMKEFNVYIEDFNGNLHDEYTIEAETLDQAYDKAYENIGWKAMEVHIDEITEEKPSTLLQDVYFGGKNPLESFPTLWSK